MIIIVQELSKIIMMTVIPGIRESDFS